MGEGDVSRQDEEVEMAVMVVIDAAVAGEGEGRSSAVQSRTRR